MDIARYRPLIRVMFWCALIGATTLAVLPQPPRLPTDDLGDKFNHILAFTVMAGLASLGWPALPRLRLIAGLSVLGALIEVVQAIPALHRDCDVRDWIADTAAVGVVVLLATAIACWRGRARQQG